MKKHTHLLSLLALPLFFLACSADPIDFDFSGPQYIPDIDSAFVFNDTLNHDLLEAFGEENIHFGPFPPALDSIQFKVIGMDFVFCKRFIFDTYHNNQPIPSHADPPTYEASIYMHHFRRHHTGQGISWHRLKTQDPSQNIFTRTNDTVFVIGHDSLFTVYFIEKTFDEGSGNPTNAIIFSGTVVNDTVEVVQNGVTVKKPVFRGVRDYIIGKKILRYDYVPDLSTHGCYAPGTIEVKKHPGISNYYLWDTDTIR